MKKMILIMVMFFAILPTTLKAAEQTEIDINLKGDSQFFQFRKQMNAYNWHFEFYQKIGKGWTYGLIYQGRDGKDLQWHQMIYAFKPMNKGKWMAKFEFKANYIPGDHSVHPGHAPDADWGIHPRFTTHYRFTPDTRANLFIEPRWQGSTYIGNRSRLTIDQKLSDKDTVSFGLINHGNHDKLSKEIQYVVMYTRSF